MPILRSLRSRLLLLLVVAFLLLFGGAAYHFAGERSESLAQARQALLRTAKLITTEEALRVARAHTLLHSLAPLAGIQHAAELGSQCQRELAVALASNPDVNDILVARANGEVVCAAKPSEQSLNVARQPYFKAALVAREFVAGGPVARPSTGGLAIPVAEPLVDGVSQPQGMLAVFVGLSWPHSMRTRDELPAGARLVVRDGLGRAVLRFPERGARVGKPTAHAQLAKLALAKQEGFTQVSDGDGVRRLYGFVPFLQTTSGPLSLWVGVSQHRITALADSAFRWGTTLALGVVLLTLGMVWIGSERLFLRRVAALSRAAKQLGQGNLAARTELRPAADEVGALSRTFDEMAEGLQKKDDQLKATNKHLELINRALRVLSAVNRALLHMSEEKQLLDEMCRVLVEVGGYRMAWVGYAEDNTQKTVRPVAHSGFESQYLEGIEVTWADSEFGQEPSGTAIRTASPIVVNNVSTEPDFAPWRAEARERGYGSTVALPLKSDEGKVLGVLRAYAVEAGAFGDEEVQVLLEVAQDLSFGISTMRARAERARLEVALRKAEGRLLAALQGNLDAFCVLNPVRGENGAVVDMEFTELNAHAEVLLRRPSEELLGRRFLEVFPSYEELLRGYIPVLESGHPKDEQVSMRTLSGRTLWIRHQVVPLEDGVAVFWRDITEGMEASQKLKASEKKYRELLESLQEGIYLIDPEARTTFVNPRMAEMLGYPVEEMLGKSVFDFVAEREAQILRHRFEQRRQGVRDSYELEWLRKDGSGLYARVEGCPIYDDEGTFVGSLAAVIDLTERRRSELALERANRALKTISVANEELVRATDETQLLQAVCRVIVEQGNYPKAWVGYAEDDPGKSITPKAWAGAGVEPLVTQRNISWDAESPSGQGLVARVIRTGRSLVSHDVATDPGVVFSRELALATGTQSILVLPLLARKNRALGFLSIHGNQPGLFDEGHVALLRQLADDLSYGIEALRAKAERDRVAYEHLHHAEILRKSLMDSIKAIAATVEMRDPYTAGHQERVAELAVAVAKEVGLSKEKVQGIYVAGIVHDLGKIGTPVEILNRPGKLSAVEFALIKQHAEAGYEILRNVEFPWPIADIVRQHHERLDGSGYPHGLKDGAILPEARILAVADVVEAMASHRPYRPGLGIERALQEIERGRGTLYDAPVVDACVKLFREGRFSFEQKHPEHTAAVSVPHLH